METVWNVNVQDVPHTFVEPNTKSHKFAAAYRGCRQWAGRCQGGRVPDELLRAILDELFGKKCPYAVGRLEGRVVVIEQVEEGMRTRFRLWADLFGIPEGTPDQDVLIDLNALRDEYKLRKAVWAKVNKMNAAALRDEWNQRGIGFMPGKRNATITRETVFPYLLADARKLRDEERLAKQVQAIEDGKVADSILRIVYGMGSPALAVA